MVHGSPWVMFHDNTNVDLNIGLNHILNHTETLFVFPLSLWDRTGHFLSCRKEEPVVTVG